MPICSIRINNFKSLQRVFLNLNNKDYDIYCLLGRNGSGKSSLLDAIKYFYDNLNKYSVQENVVDNSNPYIQKMEISLTYELSDLMVRNTNGYIKDMLDNLSQYLDKNNRICVRLVQYRDNIIKWYPDDRKLLKSIYKLFPIYLIDTRFINLQDWDIIWEIMSDLSQTTLKLKDKELKIVLDTAFEKIYGDKYLKSLRIIEKTFRQENIKMNQYDYTMRFKSSLISRLGGNEFIHLGNKLGYYSDGLNSFKYLKLLLYLVPALANTGWKNPMLIIDEPEIGLHPQYIDMLVDAIGDSVQQGVNVLLSTHSPSLVCELIKRSDRAAMFRVSSMRGYTKIEKMNEIVDEISKPILSINESNCYFSNAVVFVEGTSEMQLLAHNKLKVLFPALGKIHIHPYDSNNTKLRFIYPEIINFNIPYLVVIDMDKIFKFIYLKGSNEGYFKIKNDELVNPLSNKELDQKEQYLFYSTKDYIKQNRYNLKQYIKKMIRKATFQVKDNFYYLQDDYFENLIKLTKCYCEEYNVFPVKTTVEGLIVTDCAVSKIIKWFHDENVCDLTILDSILNKDYEILGKEDMQYRARVMRLICNGKTDTLETLKEVPKFIISDDVKTKIYRLRNSLGKKADGWIVRFMNYYFNNYINEIDENQARRKAFEDDFPELFSLLQKIEFMI